MDDTKNKKPRGRPKKKLKESINTIDVKKQFVNNNANNLSIILHIPLYYESSTLSELSELSDNHNEIDNHYTAKERDGSDSDTHLSDTTCELKETVHDTVIKNLTEKRIWRDSSLIVNDELVNLNKFDIFEKRDIACWWCTYFFQTEPCFIVEKYYDGKYYVYGYFCSPECSVAYTLKDDEHKITIRVSLINKLYNKLYGSTNIRVAPQKEILDKYGGDMSIGEFRKDFLQKFK